jgi:hypothetical protein
LLETLAHYGVSLGVEGYYARADCPLPIIAARAFSQASTVQALLNLGVKDADPMQSMLTLEFASTKHPRDLPASEHARPVEYHHSCGLVRKKM